METFGLGRFTHGHLGVGDPDSSASTSIVEDSSRRIHASTIGGSPRVLRRKRIPRGSRQDVRPLDTTRSRDWTATPDEVLWRFQEADETMGAKLVGSSPSCFAASVIPEKVDQSRSTHRRLMADSRSPSHATLDTKADAPTSRDRCLRSGSFMAVNTTTFVSGSLA
jgi:hypothetical protein